MTAAQLAAKAEISGPYLSLIESEERVPPLITLDKLGRALQVDVEVFLALVPSGGAPPRSRRVRDLTASLKRLADAEDALKQQLG